MQRFARDKQFKLYGNGKLYHIPRDLTEQRPLPAQYDWKESATARETLQAVLDEMPAPLPK